MFNSSNNSSFDFDFLHVYFPVYGCMYIFMLKDDLLMLSHSFILLSSLFMTSATYLSD